MQGGKGGLWIVVLLIAAAGCWLAWTNFGLRIVEPPIEEQIQTQVAAIRANSSVPLPIPIQIGKTTISTFDVALFEGALRGAGYSESKTPLTEKLGDTPGGLGQVSWRVFEHFSAKSAALITTLKSGKVADINSISFAARGALATDPLAMISGDSPEQNTNVKTANLGVGAIKIGMSENKVRAALSKLPQNSAPGIAELTGQLGGIPGAPLAEISQLAALNPLMEPGAIKLSRGRHIYSFTFSSGRLSRIQIIEIKVGDYGAREIVSADLAEALIRIMFDKPKDR